MCTVQFTTFGVYQVMLKLDENKATGPDGLSPCAHEFAPSLTFLFNFTLSSGTIPAQWKSANVIPVFKKGDKSSVPNYRPIPLLCAVSKIIFLTAFACLFGL